MRKEFKKLTVWAKAKCHYVDYDYRLTEFYSYKQVGICFMIIRTYRPCLYDNFASAHIYLWEEELRLQFVRGTKVYGSGRDLVILNKEFYRVQVLANIAHVGSEITCVAAEESTGKIAASDGKTIFVFDVQEPDHSPPAWRCVTQIVSDELMCVSALAWLPRATICRNSLIVCGTTGGMLSSWEEDQTSEKWHCVWHHSTPGIVHRLEFSPDGRFLACLTSTIKENVVEDELEIWCQLPGCSPPRPHQERTNGVDESVSASDFTASVWTSFPLSHPGKIVAFVWRRGSSFLPPGWLPNALLTSCSDGVARIWIECLSSEFSTNNMSFVSPTDHQNVVKAFSNSSHGDQNFFEQNNTTIPPMLLHHPILRFYLKQWWTHQTIDIRDESFSFNVTPELLDALYCGDKVLTASKFCLAASISANDPNLFSSSIATNSKGEYVVYWMDNKAVGMEQQFKRVLHLFINDLSTVPIGDFDAERAAGKFTPQLGVFDQTVLKFLNEWRRASDAVFMLHPADGSLFIWSINGLDRSSLNTSMLSRYAFVMAAPYYDGLSRDGSQSMSIGRQQLDGDGAAAPQQRQRVCQTAVSLRSRVPDVMSARGTLSVLIHNRLHFITHMTFSTVCSAAAAAAAAAKRPRDMLCNLLGLRITLSTPPISLGNKRKRARENSLLAKMREIQLACSTTDDVRHPASLNLVTTNVDGAINQLQFGLGDCLEYTGVFEVAPAGHTNGHRGRPTLLSSHPILSLFLTSSSSSNQESEMLLWLPSTSPGPLASPSTLLQPIARISVGPASIAWFPCLITPPSTPGEPSFSSEFSSATEVPITLFVADGGVELSLFLALIEAPEQLLSLPVSVTEGRLISESRNSGLGGFIVQLKATFDAGHVESNDSMLLLHVMPTEFVGPWDANATSDFLTPGIISSFLVLRVTSRNGSCRVEMWQINLDAGHLTRYEVLTSSDPFDAFDDLVVSVVKVTDHLLPLERGVHVTEVRPGAGHVGWAPLAASHIPPPYLMITACSDRSVRFWNIIANVEGGDSGSLLWSEWQMPLPELSRTSRIQVPCGLLSANLSTKSVSVVEELQERSRNLIGLSPSHSPCRLHNETASRMAEVRTIACTCNGRIAIACGSYSKLPNTDDPVQVAIFECESSGGCEWMLEDIIIPSKKSNLRSLSNVKKTVVQLDWINTEDGGHMLSILWDNQLWVYSAICHDIFVATRSSRVQNSNTLLTTLGEVGLRWTCLRHILLSDSLEGRNDLAASVSQPALWLPNGLLLVNQTTELHVFTQWPSLEGSDEMGPIRSSVTSMASAPGFAKDPFDSADFSAASMGSSRLQRTYSEIRLTAKVMSNPAKATNHHGEAGDIYLGDVLGSGSVQAKSHLNLAAIAKVSKLQPLPQSATMLHEDTLLANIGLFEAGQLINPMLPQFHPRQMLEWMNLGRLRRVQALLVHLTRCLSAFDVAHRDTISKHSDKTRRSQTGDRSQLLKPRYRSQSISELVTRRGSTLDENGIVMVANSMSSNIDIPSITPLPLYVLLALDSVDLQQQKNPLLQNSKQQHKSKTAESEIRQLDNFDALADPSLSLNEFHLSIDELDNISDDGDKTDKNDDSTSGASSIARRRSLLEVHGYLTDGKPSNPKWDLHSDTLGYLIKFTQADAQSLSELLSNYRLPGLSRLDQMYLLGIAELMANTRSDVTERLSGVAMASKSMSIRSELHQHMSNDGESTNAGHDLELDECGLRYLMVMQLFSNLCATLPPVKRRELLKSGITSRSFVWAFHSDAQEVLLNFLPSQKQTHAQSASDAGLKFSAEGTLTWSEFKLYGCGWWLRNDTVLQTCCEKIARSEFLRSKDPMDSAIFYLAMRKNTVLASLFKSLGNKALENFFRSDFTPGATACRQAKLNAFRLLSQHRFQQAAALFLAGGWLDDAIRVCVDSMQDLQLAVVISRLYSASQIGAFPDGSPFHKILRTFILSHRDPYLRSIAFWSLSDPLNSLKTLLKGPPSPPCQRHPSDNSVSGSLTSLQLDCECGSLPGFEVCPSVFKLYTYLRSHPLVTRQLRLLQSDESVLMHQIGVLDRRLYFRTAYHYSAIGCPALALEVLTRLPETAPSCFTQATGSVNSPRLASSPKSPSTLGLTSAVVETDIFVNDDIPSKNTEDVKFQISWSDDEDEKNEETESRIGTTLNSPTYESDTIIKPPHQHEPDRILAQLKFAACVRIFTEELCGFSTATPGTRLRQHLWFWLEHELDCLKTITNAHLHCDDLGICKTFHEPMLTLPPPVQLIDGQPSYVSLEQRKSIEGFFLSPLPMAPLATITTAPETAKRSKLLLARRLAWLKSNTTFIYSLIDFCGLNGASGVDLHPVRIELLQLITEGFAATQLTPMYPSVNSLETTCDSEDGGKKRSAILTTSGRYRFLNAVPLLRSVFLVPPGVMYLPRPLYLLKSLVDDINATLNSLPPPFLLRSATVDNLVGDAERDRHRQVCLLRNLCLALSASVFQALSTGGWSTATTSSENECLVGDADKRHAGIAVPTEPMNSRSLQRLAQQSLPLKPNTEPCNWPGVTGLKMSSSSFRQFEGRGPAGTPWSQRLLGLLAEALVGVYIGLMVCALYSRDCSTLYRLAFTRLDASGQTWARLFGGGYRLKPVRPVAPPLPKSSLSAADGQLRPPNLSPRLSTSGSTPPQMSLLMFPKSSVSSSRTSSPTQSSLTQSRRSSAVPAVGRSISPGTPPCLPDEWFLPPQCPMLSCFLQKPSTFGKSSTDACFVYNSETSSVPSDYEDYEVAIRRRKRRVRRRQKEAALTQKKPIKQTRRSSSSSSDYSIHAEEHEDPIGVLDVLPKHRIAIPGGNIYLKVLNSDFGSGVPFVETDVGVLDASIVSSSGEEEDEDSQDDLEDGADPLADEVDRAGFHATPSFSSGDLEWMDGDSYSWRLIRLALMQLVDEQIQELIRLLKLDSDYLSTYAPSVVKTMTLVNMWRAGYATSMQLPLSSANLTPQHEENSGLVSLPPANFIPYLANLQLINAENEKRASSNAPTPSSLQENNASNQLQQLPEAAKRAIGHLRHLLSPKNSPFQTRDPFSLPVKRLWFGLLSQPSLSDTFLRFIFRPARPVRHVLAPILFERKAPQTQRTASKTSSPDLPPQLIAEDIDPAACKSPKQNTNDVECLPLNTIRKNSDSFRQQLESSLTRLLHRDIEPIMAMCLDRIHHNFIAVALPKQLIELSISSILAPADWLGDELEYDLEALRNPHVKPYPEGGFDDFLLYDKAAADYIESNNCSNNERPGVDAQSSSTSRKLGSKMVLRRSVAGVQKLAAHPLLPFYLCGTSSGSVHVLEWGSSDPVVSTLTNTFALTPQGLAGPLAVGVRGNPVSVLQMDFSGKRFACGDTSGNFGLWNLEISGPNRHPYFNGRCHAKGIAGFSFLGGSSTQFVTVGSGAGSSSLVLSGGTGGGNLIMTTPSHWSSHRALNTPYRSALSQQGVPLMCVLESANLVVWDSLLPKTRAAVICVSETPCLDTAGSCVASLPSISTDWRQEGGDDGHQLVVGTKRGEVVFIDLRGRGGHQIVSHFTAHDNSPVRSILVDKTTNTLITAGADSAVKVWRLSDSHLMTTFQSDVTQQHNRAAAASIAAAALFRGNQSAAVVAASKPGISDLLLLPTTLANVSSSVAHSTPNLSSLPLFSSRFLACGVNGCLQLCSIVPRPDPLWLEEY